MRAVLFMRLLRRARGAFHAIAGATNFAAQLCSVGVRVRVFGRVYGQLRIFCINRRNSYRVCVESEAVPQRVHSVAFAGAFQRAICTSPLLKACHPAQFHLRSYERSDERLRARLRFRFDASGCCLCFQRFCVSRPTSRGP